MFAKATGFWLLGKGAMSEWLVKIKSYIAQLHEDRLVSLGSWKPSEGGVSLLMCVRRQVNNVNALSRRLQGCRCRWRCQMLLMNLQRCMQLCLEQFLALIQTCESCVRVSCGLLSILSNCFVISSEDHEHAKAWAELRIKAGQDIVKDQVGVSLIHQWRWDSASLW